MRCTLATNRPFTNKQFTFPCQRELETRDELCNQSEFYPKTNMTAICLVGERVCLIQMNEFGICCCCCLQSHHIRMPLEIKTEIDTQIGLMCTCYVIFIDFIDVVQSNEPSFARGIDVSI